MTNDADTKPTSEEPQPAKRAREKKSNAREQKRALVWPEVGWSNKPGGHAIMPDGEIERWDLEYEQPPVLGARVDIWIPAEVVKVLLPNGDPDDDFFPHRIRAVLGKWAKQQIRIQARKGRKKSA